MENIQKNKQNTYVIVPVYEYGNNDTFENIKDDVIKMSASNMVMVPALEGLIEKKLTKEGALNLLSKYKEYIQKYPKNSVVVGIPEDVKLTIEILRILKENSYLLVSPQNPIKKEEFLIYEKKILVVDLHNYYHKIYYGTPKTITPQGESVSLKKALEKLLAWANKKYDFIVFANDSKSSIRKSKKITEFLEHYGYQGGYKGKRKEKEKDLVEQIEECNNYLKTKYKVLEVEGYEADDVIASAVKKILPYTLLSEIHILSSDKDLFQIIGDFTPNIQNTEIKILHPKEKLLMGKNECFKKYGVYPEQMLDFLSLVGDPVDSIPGAKGIGEKTATSLINKYSNLKNIFNNLNEIEEKIKDKLLASGTLITVSKDLVYLRKHLLENTKIEEIINKINKE